MMNKEDILKILEGAKDKNGDVPMRLVRQAFKKLPEPCTDTISRQAAIDAIIHNIMPTKKGYYEPSEVLCELMQVPSAQPEQRDSRSEMGIDDFCSKWEKKDG